MGEALSSVVMLDGVCSATVDVYNAVGDVAAIVVIVFAVIVGGVEASVRTVGIVSEIDCNVVEITVVVVIVGVVIRIEWVLRGIVDVVIGLESVW